MFSNPIEKRCHELSFGTCIALGALYGASTGLIYSFVEICLLILAPWLMMPHYAYAPFHAGYTALFAGFYGLGFALVGAAGAVVVWAMRVVPFIGKASAHRLFRMMTSSALVGMFAIHLAVESLPSRSSAQVAFWILPALILAAVGSLGAGTWARVLWGAGNPWVVALLCVGSQWIIDQMSGSTEARKASALLGAMAIVLVAGAWFERRVATRNAPSPQWSLGAVSFAVLLLCAISALLHPIAKVTPVALGPAPSGKPNVILIVLDTVRADHLSVYGYKRNTTPNLARFAEQATLYTNAISSGDMTLSSHASMFTGLYPSTHGAHFDADSRSGHPLDPRQHALAEILAGQGYSTLAVVANWGYVSHKWGFDKGFGFFDQRSPAAILKPVTNYYLRFRVRNLLTRLLPTSELDRAVRSAGEINQSVFSQLDAARNSQRPFFLFVNYMDAHDPYLSVAPYDRMFPGKDASFTERNYHVLFRDVLTLRRPITDAEQDHLISRYDGSIAYLDAQLQVLFERLRSLGLYENTMIIIHADHGEMFGERNFLNHGGMSVYQEQVRVPLIIKQPYSSQGAVVDQVVGGVDLFPTILGTLGYEIPKEAQGRNLLRLDSGESRMVISESFPGGTSYAANRKRFNRVQRALYSGSLKFIGSSDGTRELYDLSADPGETRNLYQLEDPKSRLLENSLVEWTRTMDNRSNQPVTLDKDTIERLRSLGYVQ